jgi:hypothetical protein
MLLKYGIVRLEIHCFSSSVLILIMLYQLQNLFSLFDLFNNNLIPENELCRCDHCSSLKQNTSNKL